MPLLWHIFQHILVLYRSVFPDQYQTAIFLFYYVHNTSLFYIFMVGLSFICGYLRWRNIQYRQVKTIFKSTSQYLLHIQEILWPSFPPSTGVEYIPDRYIYFYI